jgi:serine/threonine protein kinase
MSTKIGHFEILSELAKSATSVVYKANDPKTSQTVALKAIQLSAFGESAVELEKCLLAEAEASKALTHPNLTPVYGAGKIDGQFFAAMEYIQGNSIATMLARKEGFSIWDLLDIGRQVCSGLDHAQSHNISHFSLEPAKIMCGWDGTVRILGYGVSSVGKFTQQVGGVPHPLHYMSPEQVRGETIDARSNLFSLGAIFYEMATDRKAFDGEDADFLRRSILEGAPVAPASVNAKLHPALSELILKALAKDPEARYQNGKELLDDLEKCKESKPQPAKQVAVPAKSVTVSAATKAAMQGKFTGAPAQAGGSKQPAQATFQTQEVQQAKGKTGVPAMAAKAAAVSGAPGSSTATKSTSKAISRPSPAMSAATMDETANDMADAPRFAVDPLMAESAPAQAARASFSEMTELPPLDKEIYSAPPPPPPQPLPAQSTRAEQSSRSEGKPEKTKFQPREAASKAMKEVKGVPPRLIGYSVAVASALIVIVALALYLRINGLSSDGDSDRPASASTPHVAVKPAAVSSPTAQSGAAQPAEIVEKPLPEHTESDTDASPWVPVAEPRANVREKTKKALQSTTSAVAVGQLAIDSSPQGAQIQLDGKTDPSWVTPIVLSGITSGQHSITFSKAGYSADTRTVTIASNSKVSVAGRLNQLLAAVAVTSDPPGANIYIDGKNTGKLTPARISVDKGQHVVLVRKAGYIDETMSEQFALGRTVNFTPGLRPLGNVDDIRIVGKMKKLFGGKEAQGMGTISVRTQPKGAQIAVNQHMLDKESPVDFILDPGNYMVDITMSGYAPVHKVITVERGGKVVIEETLRPQ